MWQTKNNQYPIKIAGKGTLRPEKQVGVFFGPHGYFFCRDNRHFKLQNELGHGKRGGDGAFFPPPPNPFSRRCEKRLGNVSAIGEYKTEEIVHRSWLNAFKTILASLTV